jgi:hypothetical protein
MDMSKSFAAATVPMSRLAVHANRLLAGEIAGIPVAIIACTIAAAIFGGVVAISAGA